MFCLVSIVCFFLNTGLIIAGGNTYAQKSSHSEKPVILLGSGPVPKYLVQNGYEIIPIYGGLKNFQAAQQIDTRENPKSTQPKSVFLQKRAPFAPASRKNFRKTAKNIPIKQTVKIQSTVLSNPSDGYFRKDFLSKDFLGQSLEKHQPVNILRSDKFVSKVQKSVPNTRKSVLFPLSSKITTDEQNPNIKSEINRKVYIGQPQSTQPQVVTKTLINKEPKLSPGGEQQVDTQKLEIPILQSKTISDSDTFQNYGNAIPNKPDIIIVKNPVEVLELNNENSVSLPYSFGYDLGDGLGTTQYRRETADTNGIVKGNYGYKDYNGIYRQVDYVADKTGFHAIVKSNEPGVGHADSADVTLLAEYR